jgi:hypothetical protein
MKKLKKKGSDQDDVLMCATVGTESHQQWSEACTVCVFVAYLVIFR